MTKHAERRLALAMTAVTVVLIGCDDTGVGPVASEFTDVAHASTLSESLSVDPEVSAWLASLREATAQFQSSDVAAAAQWDTPITGCMEMSGVGGMGYHYANGNLIDAVAEDVAPEILLYEPQKNGRLRLVGVEYIVPFTFVPDDAPPPTLHGVEFHQNYAFGLWALHAWVWKSNPAGIFEDWNPNVTCTFAE